ncbi:hypothetical protein TNCV_3755511 [Trichonephila clavipes]|nr:hypothetical protein TNCV_3755511 [Trichonephila clavipes]
MPIYSRRYTYILRFGWPEPANAESGRGNKLRRSEWTSEPRPQLNVQTAVDRTLQISQDAPKPKNQHKQQEKTTLAKRLAGETRSVRSELLTTSTTLLSGS